MMTDPISDLLTRIRNANMVKREVVEIPSSRIKKEIAQILYDKGFINGYAESPDQKQGILKIQMKYGPKGENVIHCLKRISKPSRRFYKKAEEIKPILNLMGIAIISTSHGIMTTDEAKKRNIGGEVLCEVW